MFKTTLGNIIRIIALCLLVGLVLAFFDIRPLEIFTHLNRTISAMAGLIRDFFAWAMPFILRGAEVVVPIALILLLLRWRGRPKSR